jgi:protein involved in ribonucleotide reduction
MEDSALAKPIELGRLLCSGVIGAGNITFQAFWTVAAEWWNASFIPPAFLPLLFPQGIES